MITKYRILEVFFGRDKKKSNAKPHFKNQDKFEEFLEKLWRAKPKLLTGFNKWTYLQNPFIFYYQRLLTNYKKGLKMKWLNSFNAVDKSV